jgi:hypothetical protein
VSKSDEKDPKLQGSQRIERCIAKLNRGEAPDDPIDAARELVAACAPLYSKQACREGMFEATAKDTDPSQRMRIMLEACRDAYCPELPNPKPELCAFTTRNTDLTRWSEIWEDFNVVILARELGAELDPRLLERRKTQRAARASVVASNSEPSSPLLIEVKSAAISLSGVQVGDVGAIEAGQRMTRIDGLFEALKQQSRTAEIRVILEPSTSGLILSSVLQTAEFTGHNRFALETHAATPATVPVLINQASERRDKVWLEVQTCSRGPLAIAARSSKGVHVQNSVARAELTHAARRIADTEHAAEVVLRFACTARVAEVLDAVAAVRELGLPVSLAGCGRVTCLTARR